MRRPPLSLRPFHIAFAVDDLDAARHFYGTVMGCPEGRSSEQWIDFDLFGHQIVAHYNPPAVAHAPAHTAARAAARAPIAHRNAVDGHDVPVPHFGVVLTKPQWLALAQRMRGAAVPFIVEPHTRFEGKPGEQSTMFFLDPAGNALEFKAFDDLGRLFAR